MERVTLPGGAFVFVGMSRSHKPGFMLWTFKGLGESSSLHSVVSVVTRSAVMASIA
jgi:hypothetical protein